MLRSHGWLPSSKPARVRATENVAESAVGYVSRQIIAALRNQKFFSIDEMNTQVWDRMDQLNSAEFKKKEGSCLLLFTEQERQELLPLSQTL